MNKNKSYIIGIVVVALIGIIMLVSSRSQTAPVSETPAISTDGTSASHETTNPNTTTDTQTNTSTTTTAGQYTMADVAIHNSQSSCWTTINGGIYDVTSWISQHPGGERAILGLCGIDGSSAFNGQHGGQARPASELASFKIGTLKQ